MRISVIGAGYVGLTTAACLAEIGHQVFCAENNAQKLKMLMDGKVPFFEPYLPELVERNGKSGRLEFGSLEAAIDHGQALFICVGTPPLENGEADLSAVERVAYAIAQRGNGYRLVIEKSTVPVQTGQQLKRCFSFYGNGHFEFDLASNPEFLREGSAIEDCFHPDRIVVGVESARAADLLKQIYQPLLEQTYTCPVHTVCDAKAQVPFVVTDINSAEIIKHASNSFLAMKISFINLVSDLCEAAGADINEVAVGMGLDRRIGPSFLRPGLGFGGFCFPKDLQAFIRIAEKFRCDFSLLKEAERINLRRVDHFVEKVKQELWILQGKKVAIWGLAYKPDTDDIRCAPSLELIKRLLAEGVEIQAYDPQAIENTKAQFPALSYCKDVYETAIGVAAILIVTEWLEFLDVDWGRLRSVVQRPLVIDGRNMFSRAQVEAYGFDYVDMGRAPVQAAYNVSAPVSARLARQVAFDPLNRFTASAAFETTTKEVLEETAVETLDRIL